MIKERAKLSGKGKETTCNCQIRRVI